MVKGHRHHSVCRSHSNSALSSSPLKQTDYPVKKNRNITMYQTIPEPLDDPLTNIYINIILLFFKYWCVLV